MKSSPSDDYLTPEEVVERYRGKISLGTLANWRSGSSEKNGPPFTKVGGAILYPRRKLLAWELRRTKK